MIMYVETSIWESPAQTLVNTINTVGAMGKGIALQFKKRYPDMYDQYRQLCKDKHLDVGKLWMYKADDRNILNFPTKKHWRNPSKVEYIKAGLEKFLHAYEVFNITSISFPQLGTGNGGLDWEAVVQPLMDAYLRNIPIPVYVHLMKPRMDFTPEYNLPINEAIPFDVLLDDIKDLSGKRFKTLSKQSSFVFLGIKGENLSFSREGAGRTTNIPVSQLKLFWDDLNRKRIAKPSNSFGQIARYYSYLLPVLTSVHYIKAANIADDHELLREQPSKGVMVFRRDEMKSEVGCYELPY